METGKSRILKRLATIGLLGVFVALCFTNAQAAPSSYGLATHSDARWQELATYNEFNNAISEYGVFWSTDNGTTWGHEDLYVGDVVQFKFNVHKDETGTHYADILKAWVDWGQNGKFDESTDVVAYGERIVRTYENSTSIVNPKNFTYYSDKIEILDSYIGETWLRARVTCSESIMASISPDPKWSKQWLDYYKNNYDVFFAATGNYYQGEVEEWLITVNPSAVPEPATMILLGFGLMGLSRLGRNKKLG